MKSILVLFLFFISLFSFAQSDMEKAKETVQQNTLKSHIYFLADDLLEGRGTGTTGNKIAASYLANSLRKYGVQPNPITGDYYQRFNLRKARQPKKMEVELAGAAVDESLTLDAEALNFSGDAVVAGYGLEEDYAKIDAKDKILVVKAGTPEASDARSAYYARADKRKLAMAKGAKGLIEVASFDNDLWGVLSHALGEQVGLPSEQDQESPFLHLWVQSNPALTTALEQKTIPVSIDTDGIQEETIATQNVVGFVEGTDPELKDEYIMYSAHYDHVGIGEPDATGDTIYNGARDNAIGTTAVLSMAENLGQYPTKRSAIFIFFTAEEKGLIGSRYYVENPLMPLKNIVYGFNTDGGGYNNTELATIIGLGRTTAEKHMIEGAKTFGLKAIDDPAPEQGLFDRSDNVSFAKVGIPAPTYSTGFDAFDEEINKYYHQAGDEADSLDYDYLLKFFRGYVLSGRLIANDPVTPFWVKGDKYEAAGNELYQRNRPVKQ